MPKKESGMNLEDPAFLYIALILPSLFALTMVADGLHKVLRKESGWINFLMGMAFLAIILYAYFSFLR